MTELPDLGALKHMSAAAMQEKVANDHLRNHGFVCPCGERIRDTGITAFGIWKGTLGSEHGAILGQFHFCSLDCPEYEKARDEGVDVGPERASLIVKLLGYRELQPVIWLDEPPWTCTIPRGLTEQRDEPSPE